MFKIFPNNCCDLDVHKPWIYTCIGITDTNGLTNEKNRPQNRLTVSNLKLDNVFSDVFGKSARFITTYMLDRPGESFDVAPFVNG